MAISNPSAGDAREVSEGSFVSAWGVCSLDNSPELRLLNLKTYCELLPSLALGNFLQLISFPHL